MPASLSAAMPPRPVGIIQPVDGYLNQLLRAQDQPEQLSPEGAYRQTARSEAVDLIGLAGGAVLALLNRDFHDELGLRRHDVTPAKVTEAVMPFLSAIDSTTHGRYTPGNGESGPTWATLHTLTQFTLRAARATAFGDDRVFSAEYAADSVHLGEGLGVRQLTPTHDAITGDFQREVGAILSTAVTNEGRGWNTPWQSHSRISMRTAHARALLNHRMPLGGGGELALKDYADSIFDAMGRDIGPLIAHLLGVYYQPGRGLAKLEEMGAATPPGIGEWSTQAAQLAATVGPPRAAP